MVSFIHSFNHPHLSNRHYRKPKNSTQSDLSLAQLISSTAAMKLDQSLYLLATTLTLAPSSYAGCYSGGESWNKNVAVGAIHTACKRLAGSYAGQQYKEVEIKVPH